MSGSSAIAGFRPHRSHRAALPQWALQKGPEAGRSSGRFVHTREVRLQGLPALCPALRLPRRDPFLPLPFLHRLVSFGDFIDSMERSDSHPRCGELWSSLVRRPHRRPLVDADGSHRFRNGPFGRDVVQAPGGASGLSHDETRCAAFAGAGASSASATCRFRESIPHPVQPLSTLRTPRRRDARKTRSRPACSALNGPDFHWQAHSSFPLAPRIRLSDKTSRRLSRATPSAASEHRVELIGFPISMSFATFCVCLELRSLPSAGVTRFPRYYEPLRHPRAPGLSLTGVRLVLSSLT